MYEPSSREVFKLSRTKIELFLECPRCFYFDRRLGVSRPPGFPFALNSAVDTLLKLEFDTHRAKGTKHPLIEKYGVDAVPVPHKDLDQWRHNFTGVQFLHKPTNFLVFGAIDDLWARTSSPRTSQPHPNPLLGKERGNEPLLTSPLKKGRNEDEKGELEYIVVDYKSTSKEADITELNQDWQDCYKRQMEVYQWLLRQNGYKVSDTGYFVYCNGQTDRKAFDAKLEFDITLIPYTGKADWIEDALLAAKKCLDSSIIPKASHTCDYCSYYDSLNRHTEKEIVREHVAARAKKIIAKKYDFSDKVVGETVRTRKRKLF